MSILSEFKAFAVKGNVVDMAVGIIIGAAFGKIVSSFVGDLLYNDRFLALADYAAYIEAQDKVVAALYPAEPVQDSAPESQEPEESTASEAPAESEVQ